MRIEDLAHLVSEVGRPERFLQERRPFLNTFLQNDILGMAGHEQHLQAGPYNRGAFREFPSAETRHHHIAEQQIDRTVVRNKGSSDQRL